MPSVPHEMLVELLATSPQLLPPLLGDRLDAAIDLDTSIRHGDLCIRCGRSTASQVPLGPADVPAITTIEDARKSLDMTLFSGIVHGREGVAARIGLVLRQALDEAPDDVGLYYWDAFLAALTKPVRKELDMQLQRFQPRSDWSKEIYAKGEANGRAKDILVLLALRGFTPTPALRQRVSECTDLAQLDRWFRSAATAESLDAVFVAGPAPRRSGKASLRRASVARARVRELPRT